MAALVGDYMWENMPHIGMKARHREVSWNHFDKLRKKGQFCDITFQCAGGEVKAHKCILATVSEYFNTLFTSPISLASSTNVVAFDQFSVEVMTLLMDMIYTEVHVAADLVVELFRLIDYLQMDWLIVLLVENIRFYINETNFRDLHDTARSLGISRLQFLCECYVRENLERLKCEEIGLGLDLNTFKEVRLWKEDMKRNVVVIQPRFTDDKEILVDPTQDCSVIAADEKVTKFWLGKGRLVLSFLYQDIFHLITSKRKTEVGAGHLHSLWKYHQSSKNLVLLKEFELSEMSSLIQDDIDQVSCITQISYNEHDSLYVQCDLKESSDECLFKFSLKNQAFYQGYIRNDGDSILHVAYLKDLQSCWISPHCVFELDKYSFEVKELSVDALSNIQIRILENFPLNIDLEEFGWNERLPCCSSNGTFYCIITCTIDGLEPDAYMELVLKLDMVSRSWVLCSGRKMMTDGYPGGRHLFTSGTTLYLLHAKGRKRSRSFEILYLDEEECSLKMITSDSSPSTVDFSSCCSVVVPYHILVV